ncbi:MAG: hypothetical protein A3K54_00020 [Omnitrophica WOR_2 bacterium RBG_13_44_8]|nr:MAG: hypothetical protein A3K54_00020 [Omnitrophica WOR_2 bacterium RBG_13_44_8]
MAKVRWPFGEATTTALSATGDQAVSVDNDLTIIDGVTTVATGARTLNLTIPTDIKAGARMVVKTKTTGTENTVFGTGCIAPTYAGVAGKTKVCYLIYDGTQFVPVAVAFQID